MQAAFNMRIAEHPPPKVVADLQAAKSWVMSVAEKSEIGYSTGSLESIGMKYPSESRRGYGAGIYKRDGWTCRYCGLECSSFSLWLMLSVDHIIPVQQRDEIEENVDDPRNLATACMGCSSIENRRRYEIPQGHSFDQRIAAVFAQKREAILKRRRELSVFHSENVKLISEGSKLPTSPNTWGPP